MNGVISQRTHMVHMMCSAQDDGTEKNNEDWRNTGTRLTDSVTQ